MLLTVAIVVVCVLIRWLVEALSDRAGEMRLLLLLLCSARLWLLLLLVESFPFPSGDFWRFELVEGSNAVTFASSCSSFCSRRWISCSFCLM